MTRSREKERELRGDNPLIIKVIWEGNSKTNPGLVQGILLQQSFGYILNSKKY